MAASPSRRFTLFDALLAIIITVGAAGPLLIFAAIVSGGNPLDGFAGGTRSNTSLHEDLFHYGIRTAAMSALVSFLLSIVVALYKIKTDKQYLLLPLISVAVPVGGTIATMILGIVIASAADF